MQTVKMQLEGLGTHVETVASIQREILNVLYEGPDYPCPNRPGMRRELEVEVPEEIDDWEVRLSPGRNTPYSSSVCIHGSLGGVVVPLEQIPRLITQLHRAQRILHAQDA